MFTEITKESVYELSMTSFGIVPGVVKEISERTVPLAFMYLVGNQAMHHSALDDMELNAIELRISVLNNCESCIKGHTFLSKKAGLGESDIQALKNGEDTSIPRLNNLLKATDLLYSFGNNLFPDDVLNSIEDQGLTEQEIFEIIGLISLKTISNYVNNYLASVKTKHLSKRTN